MAISHISQIHNSLPLNGVESPRRSRPFAEARSDSTLSDQAKLLAYAEDVSDGHDEIYCRFTTLGGNPDGYDLARWELLRAGFPANRGW